MVSTSSLNLEEIGRELWPLEGREKKHKTGSGTKSSCTIP